METEELLLNIFEQKGIFISEEEKDDELEMDSLQFVSIVVDVESTFHISIEDDDLVQDKLASFNQFMEKIKLLSE